MKNFITKSSNIRDISIICQICQLSKSFLSGTVYGFKQLLDLYHLQNIVHAICRVLQEQFSLVNDATAQQLQASIREFRRVWFVLFLGALRVSISLPQCSSQIPAINNKPIMQKLELIKFWCMSHYRYTGLWLVKRRCLNRARIYILFCHPQVEDLAAYMLSKFDLVFVSDKILDGTPLSLVEVSPTQMHFIAFHELS